MLNYIIFFFMKIVSLLLVKNEENMKYIFERKVELKGKVKDKFFDGMNFFIKKCIMRLGYIFRIINVVNCLLNILIFKKER